MGTASLFVLVLALSAAIGLGCGLVGLFIGARIIRRDEERYAQVGEALVTVQADWAALRMEWKTTIEKLAELDESIERRRRRIAASESRLRGQDPEPSEQAEQLTPQQQRDEIRKRIRRIA